MDELFEVVEKNFNIIDSGRIYEDMVGALERIIITKALERTEGNQIAAAKLLGLNRNTLHTKVKKYAIDIGRFKR